MIENHPVYLKDLERCANEYLPWNMLNGKHILITGATGLIGSFLVDLLMYRNMRCEADVYIGVVSRNMASVKARFANYFNDNHFLCLVQDINTPIECDIKFDYIINGASNTHPIAYATDPVGTIMTNVLGTYNILNYATEYPVERIIQLSTVEIYGQDLSTKEALMETDSGYIDCNTLRAGYPEAKRTAEALCQSFISKHRMDICIARLCRAYGPSMKLDDSKVIAQFVKNAINNENIVLKSKGNQVFSYCYVADVVSSLLYILFFGNNGEAYNVADANSVVSLAGLAQTVAEITHNKVIFDLPEGTEAKGFSPAQRAVLDATKLSKLGWEARVHMKQGIEQTIDILRNEQFI